MNDALPTSGWTDGLRRDLRLIADLVESKTRVLDVGCGDGALLAHLARTKGVDARGIELSQAGVHECVSQGLAVVQGDADTDLAIYPDGSFDYVILSQTIQAMHRPREVLDNMLRIGRYCISCCAAACRSPAACPTPGIAPPTSIPARSRISRCCATSWTW